VTFHAFDAEQNQLLAADLPASPCAPGETCGRTPYALNGGGTVFLPTDQVVQWVHPLGDDRYRIFYTIEVGDPLNGVLSNVRVVYDDVTWTPVSTAPDAREAGPLVTSCARAALCAEGVVDDHRLRSCASSWTEIG